MLKHLCASAPLWQTPTHHSLIKPAGNFETYAGAADLYTYFIERGVKLLNANGSSASSSPTSGCARGMASRCGPG